MGLDSHSVKFILSGLDMGMIPDSICTLGRQSMFISAGKLASLLSQHQRCPENFWDIYPWRDASPVSDPLFRLLGFQKIDSLDNSDYEGANVVHDLNQPLPESLVEQYGLVFDGGTLEHIFLFPKALENAMRMVKPGGSLILEKPANGLYGHGFFQFSPELFFRALGPQYGFELIRIYLSTGGQHYHVVDPAIVHGRVELRKGVSSLLVHARKIGRFDGFDASPPQQSDYLASWESHQLEKSHQKSDGRLKAMLRRRLSPSAIEAVSKILNQLRQRRAIGRWKRGAVPSNRRFYIPVKSWTVPTRDVTGQQ